MSSMENLGQGVRYNSEFGGYVMLNLTDAITPLAPMTIDSVELLPKNEYHCSLVALNRIAESVEHEALLVEVVRSALANIALRFTGLNGRLYVCRKDDQITVVGGVIIEGLDELRAKINQEVPLYEPAFPHVTLLKSANSPYGIGINSDRDLNERCEPLVIS